MKLNKENIQNIDLGGFKELGSKISFPISLKMGLLGLILIILFALLVVFSYQSPTLLERNKDASDTRLQISPTMAEPKGEQSEIRQQWQAIKGQLDGLDSSQKDLLPPEIDLEIKFDQ